MAELKPIEGLDLSEPSMNFLLNVRSFLRDHPQLNRLTEGVEHSDRMVGQSVVALLSDFASMPPPLGYFELSALLDDFMLYAAGLKYCSHFLIDSVLNLMVRNELPFADGGLSIQFMPNIQILMNLSAKYKQEWDMAAKQAKIIANIKGMSGVASPTSEYYLLQAWAGSTI